MSLMRAFASIVCAVLLGAPALADAAGGRDPGDVLGTWRFQTKPYRGGQCIMSGLMHLKDAPESGVYSCELTALEVCSLWGRSRVRQSCEARRFGNQVSVRSSIEEFLETKSDLEDYTFNYVPDNFALTVQSAERMYGSLVSAVTAPVEFRRTREGVS
jgi:hypothetical protein